MWLEIIEPSGARIVRLEVPFEGEEWVHEVRHPVLIRLKVIRIVKPKEKEEKP